MVTVRYINILNFVLSCNPLWESFPETGEIPRKQNVEFPLNFTLKFRICVALQREMHVVRIKHCGQLIIT